jgi:hypothetical protein
VHTKPAVIIGRWESKEVWINGKFITLAGFVHDLKAAEIEAGANRDILQEYRGVKSFRWGYNSKATYCLALACCFYFKCSWVMDRFFMRELKRARLEDLRIAFSEGELQAAFEQCEEVFAREFKELMRELGAEQLEE